MQNYSNSLVLHVTKSKGSLKRLEKPKKVVWLIFCLMNTFTAFKGSQFYFIMTAVLTCGAVRYMHNSTTGQF